MNSTPKDNGFRQPAEWARHTATWVAWPFDPEVWGPDLAEAQSSFTALCQALRDERLEVLVANEGAEAEARRALTHPNVGFHRVPYWDIWLRDTAPIFIRSDRGELAAMQFGFNGWGAKFLYEVDTQVSARVAALSGLRTFRAQLVLEGGSVDTDGEGTVLTTKQCLLNENRNPGMTQDELERQLGEFLGASRVLWLDEGLLNDHTDGHIDTIARFVHPGVVMCMEPSGADDPNRDVLKAIIAQLKQLTDARGRRLEVVTLPSPGEVLDRAGAVMPASYVNFYIGNGVVVVPTYGSAYDDAAVQAIERLFPKHRVTGVLAKAILTGGGAFHCITQQQPA